MKKIILLFLVILSTYNSTNAQTVIKNATNTLMGYVENGNLFNDLNSSQILDFSVDGLVKDLGGDTSATYNRANGQIKDRNGDLLFTIDGNNVKSPSNHIVATVDENGNLKDADNFQLGSIAGIDKYYITFYFLVYNKL